jgi:hypothetical protein
MGFETRQVEIDIHELNSKARDRNFAGSGDQLTKPLRLSGLPGDAKLCATLSNKCESI